MFMRWRMVGGAINDEICVGGFTENFEDVLVVFQGNSEIKKVDLRSAYFKGELYGGVNAIDESQKFMK